METETPKPELFTESVPAGKRTYHVNVKVSREGVKYLNVVESKRKEDGSYERNSVIVFEEHLKDLLASLKKALVHFNYTPKPEKSHMEELKEKFYNAYQPWTQEEDDKLELLFCEKKTVKELSETFQRNEGAIRSRIKKLELKEKYV